MKDSNLTLSRVDGVAIGKSDAERKPKNMSPGGARHPFTAGRCALKVEANRLAELC